MCAVNQKKWFSIEISMEWNVQIAYIIKTKEHPTGMNDYLRGVSLGFRCPPSNFLVGSMGVRRADPTDRRSRHSVFPWVKRVGRCN